MNKLTTEEIYQAKYVPPEQIRLLELQAEAEYPLTPKSGYENLLREYQDHKVAEAQLQKLHDMTLEEVVEEIVEKVTKPVLRKDCRCDVWKWGRNGTCPTCTAREIAIFKVVEMEDK